VPAVGSPADRELAVSWQGQLRAGDLVARIGGEEFGVLLPGCSIASATTVLQRLRAATPGDATCSAGLVERVAGESAESLVARADATLYSAKDAGRDQLLVSASQAAVPSR